MQEKIYGGDVRIGSSADPYEPPTKPPTTSVPEGYAVDVDVEAPKQSAPAQYIDEKIPERFKGVQREEPNVDVETVNNSSIDNSGKSDTINVEVDEFVPCLKDAVTGEILPTEVAQIPKSELRKYTKKKGWGVDWKNRPDDEYTLGVFIKDEKEPQGLISLRKDNGGVYLGFASTAPHNNKQITGGNQKYIGVGGHLFAAAIEESVKAGSGGYIYGFAANTKLLQHYIEDLGAYHFPILHPYQFVVEGEAAQNLIDTYNYERRR